MVDCSVCNDSDDGLMRGADSEVLLLFSDDFCGEMRFAWTFLV